MNQHTPALHRALVVRTSFEPSHVAAACTAGAYEYVVPFIQRPLSHGRPSRPDLFATCVERQASAEGGAR